MKKLSPPTSIPSEPVFRGFEGQDFWRVPGYVRHLPHWRLDGATYFVTFRLADSIPERIVRRWECEREAWLHAHGILAHWQKDDAARFYLALAAVPREERAAFQRKQSRRFFIELDRCHGCCPLRDPEASRLVSDALLHFHGERVWTGDFVIMPNHVHVIVQAFPGVTLEDWLYSVKRFTSLQMGRKESVAALVSRRSEHLWQIESFDRVIRDEAELARTREYIAKNPRRMKKGEFRLHRAEWPAP
ncbi:MAG: transposase [Prosthecobacter sp.]|nr:transposase [Prosthecobacter sp.]